MNITGHVSIYLLRIVMGLNFIILRVLAIFNIVFINYKMTSDRYNKMTKAMYVCLETLALDEYLETHIIAVNIVLEIQLP
jgi:hypothetical protein